MKTAEDRTSQPYLSIVIPAHNEAQRLVPTLKRIRRYVENHDFSVEVMVVSDASVDGTPDLARAFDPGQMTMNVLASTMSKGKGRTVRRGMLAARGQVLLMTDADLATPIEELDKLLVWLDEGYDVVIGSRAMPDSVLCPPQGPWRRFIGKVFRKIRGMLFLPEIRDTQCGFKCFTREVADEVFSRQLLDDAAFDCEILLLAKKGGYRIKEVGVAWGHDSDSRMKLVSDSFRMLRSIIAIKWRLGSGK
ncbi:MAG: glycosyltransferase family 2 protein [Phycisphaerales bacterium]|nr:glycosyltransferase family 2 protein [Phycisphaerales bacterium]